MKPRLRSAIELVLEQRIESATRVSGGDINEAYRVELADRRTVFVKSNPRAPKDLFEAEAHGLDWLRSAGALRVPAVLAVGQGGSDAFLVLEWIEPGPPGPRFDERLGSGLAQLHRHGASLFGLDRDNYIGRLPQSNRRYERFADFFVEQRLVPQFDLAERAGHFDTAARERFERLLSMIPRLLGAEEPPARLHGDLWSGNYLIGEDGEPWLIDPAVYGGHREIDLAMMRLFGGFSARVFDAYRESFPLAAGYDERLQLMQLYPLLVHVNLFGGGYVARVRQIIDAYTR